ncbi:MAG: hypothetical protein C4K60_15400 [Ideonella sp. MAG2]|nr:MAG: hypothetical protein C4K60_15400 [Ideonella sp. MAG2]
MQQPCRSKSTNDVWASAFGSVVVGAIFILLLLTAFAGWSWVAKFLESSAPAWIQAVGSVAAIVAALAVVQRQHTLELKRRERDDFTSQLRRARSLRVLFYSAARACEDVGRRIGKPYQTWSFLAEDLREVRARLLSIDPLLVPEGKLLLIIEECAMRLKSCSLIVAELETPRRKETEEGVKVAVMATARECWLGLFEATDIEAKLCKSEISDEKPYPFDDFDASRRRLDDMRAEFVRERKEGAERDGAFVGEQHGDA